MVTKRLLFMSVGAMILFTQSIFSMKVVEARYGTYKGSSDKKQRKAYFDVKKNDPVRNYFIKKGDTKNANDPLRISSEFPGNIEYDLAVAVQAILNDNDRICIPYGGICSLFSGTRKDYDPAPGSQKVLWLKIEKEYAHGSDNFGTIYTAMVIIPDVWQTEWRWPNFPDHNNTQLSNRTDYDPLKPKFAGLFYNSESNLKRKYLDAIGRNFKRPPTLEEIRADGRATTQTVNYNDSSRRKR